MREYNLTFKYYGEESRLPMQSGIYVVYALNRAKNIVRKIIYIGESADVYTRVAYHDRAVDWAKHLYEDEELAFSYAPITGDNDRVRAEAGMIFSNKPPCNDEYTNSFPYRKTHIIVDGYIHYFKHLNFTVGTD